MVREQKRPDPRLVPTMRASDAFEQQIQRICELLLGSGAEVTWNDHIPDPDNPGQPRRIDVTVKRDGKLTLVECREQQCRQDVQWIEELIGRRTSLGADAVIAGSPSGFTAGALKKAKRYSVNPRDLEVSLLFHQGGAANLDSATVKSELKRHPAMQSLFNAAAQQLGELEMSSRVPRHITTGEPQATLGRSALVTPRTGETQMRSAASLVMFDKNKNVIWKAP